MGQRIQEMVENFNELELIINQKDEKIQQIQNQLAQSKKNVTHLQQRIVMIGVENERLHKIVKQHQSGSLMKREIEKRDQQINHQTALLQKLTEEMELNQQKYELVGEYERVNQQLKNELRQLQGKLRD